MERDAFLENNADRRRRTVDSFFPDAGLSEPPARRTDAEYSGWRSRTAELKRTETERVQATFWSRGAELIVTLQWMVMGEDGRWMPINNPPEPGFMGEW